MTLIFLISGLKRIRSLYAKTLVWRPIAKHVYFYQKYIAKAMESVDSGGYQGLVHQANVGNKEDVSGLSDRNETQLVNMMQKIYLASRVT